MKKLGRPQKYKTEEERKQAKRINDRINQREYRRRKKLLKINNQLTINFN